MMIRPTLQSYDWRNSQYLECGEETNQHSNESARVTWGTRYGPRGVKYARLGQKLGKAWFKRMQGKEQTIQEMQRVNGYKTW